MREKAPLFTKARRKFTASMMANLVYLVVGGVFASKIFTTTNAWLGVGAMSVITAFAISSILVYPPRNGGGADA